MVRSNSNQSSLFTTLRALASMWHELRVVLHNRENTLLTLAVQAFAKEEHEFAQRLANNWESLETVVEDMPIE